MVFSSTVFLFFFLPIVLILYYLVPSKFKNIILLISSLIFYAWGEPIYIFLMCISSFVDYLNGILLTKNNNEKTRKRFLTLAILINLSLLGFFKYSDFVIGIINDVFNFSIPLLNIGLPIGISFYTFQTMSYSIDVYRRSVDVETNYFRYLTYVSLFPQLVAGPIVRYKTIAKELKDRNVNGYFTMTWDNGYSYCCARSETFEKVYNLIDRIFRTEEEITLHEKCTTWSFALNQVYCGNRCGYTFDEVGALVLNVTSAPIEPISEISNT